MGDEFAELSDEEEEDEVDEAEVLDSVSLEKRVKGLALALWNVTGRLLKWASLSLGTGGFIGGEEVGGGGGAV